MELKDQTPNDTAPDGPVVVAPKTLRRFYENIVFLDVLNQSFKNNTRKKTVESLQTEQLEDEALFHNFVWRLGQICDCRPGGFTVTAFTVLQQSGQVRYVFGSNKRTTTELEITKAYIRSILDLLAQAADCEDDEEQEVHQASLRRDVLSFNRGRVACHLKALCKALGGCISICQEGGSPRVATHEKILQNTLDKAVDTTAVHIDDDEYFERIEDLIRHLESLYQRSTTALFIQKRASDDKVGNPEPWREFRHHSGRLMAYKRAIEVLWRSGFMWPELFRGFEVTALPSSTPSTNPLAGDPQKAVDILKRYKFSKPEELARYLDMAVEVQQKFQLDDLILERWTKKTFRPFVHAEILVLNWLENHGGTRPERFFNGWRYIGSSKPACKLCSYYLSSHPSRVQFRSTHGNLYINWRMPDLMDVHGAPSTRHQILQEVGAKVREDVLRSLSDKLTDRRPHDSATNSTFPPKLRPISGGSQITATEDLTQVEDRSDAGGAATDGGDLLDPLLQELDDD